MRSPFDAGQLLAKHVVGSGQSGDLCVQIDLVGVGQLMLTIDAGRR